MGILENQEPKEVFEIFERICSIPHGSGNMEQISQFCVDFAKAQGLEYIQDEMKNVIIIREASEGYENEAPIILQGHLDMVCEKKPEKEHDFLKDGLDLRTDSKFLWADGTTLGGDDGIAVAFALAALSSGTLKHPRLEVVLTVDEEIGLLGAEKIDLSMLKGKKLINIDSEEEGILLTSCAGGLSLECTIPVETETVEGTIVQMTITGLKGGHSGCEIDKGRANSNVVAGRILQAVSGKVPFSLCEMSGGLKDNAIPRLTTAKLVVAEKDFEAMKQLVREQEEILKKELQASDGGLSVLLEKQGMGTEKAICEHSKEKVLLALNDFPNGIQTMSMDIPGLVETSLNMGVMKLDGERLRMVFAIRSSIESAKKYLTEKVAMFAKALGGSAAVSGDYPGWAYRADSKLRETFVRVYERLYGKEPAVEAIHAGLECGMLSDKIENLDCISFGPDMHHVHTTEETLDIASVQRTWEYLCAVIMEKE